MEVCVSVHMLDGCVCVWIGVLCLECSQCVCGYWCIVFGMGSGVCVCVLVCYAWNM